MTAAFTYQPLPDPANSIRLLSIEPGWPADPLRVQLITLPDRTKSPSYQALSYVWGSTLHPVPIQCNDAHFTVTQNLAAALRALRPLPTDGDPAANGIAVIKPSHVLHSSRQVWKGIARNRNEAAMLEARRVRPGLDPQLFWIDAICINQEDIQECNEQVKGMRGLYEAATSVRIWLGDKLVAPDGSELQLPEMRTSRADKVLGRVRLAELGHMPVVLAFFVQALRNSHLMDEIESGGSSEPPEIGYPLRKSPEYLILTAFFKQPWFQRVWVVQEAVMARESNITVGDWEIDWEPFSKAVTILHASDQISQPYSLQVRIMGTLSEETMPGLSTIPALFICDIRRLARRTKYLLPLLVNSRMRKATKPIDHIFALLGMAEEMVDDALTNNISTLRTELLAIDYTKPVSQVFKEATWFIIISHKTLSPLTMAELTDNHATFNCPSWVPIWSKRRKTVPLKQEIFNAAFRQEIKLSFETLDTLCVSGYRLEPVKEVTDELTNVPGHDGESPSWHYPPHQEEIDYVGSAWALVMSCLSDHDEGFLATMSQGTVLPPYRSDEQILDAFIYTMSGNWNDESHNKRADGSGQMIDWGRKWLERHVDLFARSGSLFTKIQNILQDTFYSGVDLGFQACLLAACLGRKLFITNSGFIGIGPSSMESGDLIVIILGLNVPLVLRKVDGRETPHYLLLGECYVQGIMDGELIQRQLNSRTDAEIFRLI